MAKLHSDDLTLEIKFIDFKEEWVEYEIKFYWKDEIIVNDNILKRNGEWWGKRSYGAFLANDYQKDHLIKTIKNVLKTCKSEYWEPLEPDAIIAIYPGKFFPFLKIEEEQEKWDECKQKDDLFTIITFIDSYNFKNSGAYSGEGISLHLTIERRDLEKFVTDLEIEYNDWGRAT